MNYEKKYKEALKRAKNLRKDAIDMGENIRAKQCEIIFPELNESEDEKIRKGIKSILEHYKEGGEVVCPYPFVSIDKALAWLEKQGGITKLSEEEQNRFAKGVLSSCALSFIDYLDAHKYEGKMCVSNGECEDIENAFHNAMWDRLYRYYCKYIEKQGSNLVKNGYTDNKDIIKYADNYSHEIWHKLMDNFKNIKDYHIGCNDVSDIVLNAIIDAYNWLERQGEKKPIEWKDSDEKYLFWALLSIQKDIAASEINGVNTKDLNDCVKWLYSLKQRIKEKQEPIAFYWSADDKNKLLIIEQILNCADLLISSQELTEIKNWLNSLKQRIKEE